MVCIVWLEVKVADGEIDWAEVSPHGGASSEAMLPWKVYLKEFVFMNGSFFSGYFRILPFSGKFWESTEAPV